MLSIMVNETIPYSSFQNLPYTTRIGVYNETTPINVVDLPPGKYEIILSGIMDSGPDPGNRQFVINTVPILLWFNGAEPLITRQSATLEIDSDVNVLIQLLKSPSLDSEPLYYQAAWRSTPSLELITKAELEKKNLKIKEELGLSASIV